MVEDPAELLKFVASLRPGLYFHRHVFPDSFPGPDEIIAINVGFKREKGGAKVQVKSITKVQGPIVSCDFVRLEGRA